MGKETARDILLKYGPGYTKKAPITKENENNNDDKPIEIQAREELWKAKRNILSHLIEKNRNKNQR